jgi:hypothetical protein
VGQLTELRELNLAFNMLDALPKELSRLERWVYRRDPRAHRRYDTAWIEGNPIAFPHPQVRGGRVSAGAGGYTLNALPRLHSRTPTPSLAVPWPQAIGRCRCAAAAERADAGTRRRQRGRD